MEITKDQVMTTFTKVISDFVQPYKVVPLSTNLTLDTATYILLRKSKRIPLTKREADLLMILLKSPDSYIKTEALADALSLPHVYPINEHSIEQTICGLRKKLGESGQRQSILKSRRGFGYGIFPEKSRRK